LQDEDRTGYEATLIILAFAPGSAGAAFESRLMLIRTGRRSIMRWGSSVGIGAAIMVCLVLCCGCGGSLLDTPDVSKGPSPGAAKLKKTEEMNALAKAAKAEGKGMPKGPRGR
jgi:hypothetical protein